ncbi:bifunctional 5,10-methylenetetrahydrofolate dehydrogenase/5,10-methenyltetrahydrofolate cyclohydrolase [Poseidonocella sp. HB161398]|uniref:bifunctional 5,10-methylenetetrahydrofolate dehydrogenase/5,10-methenyltetrahydrofolate cyclohydrolase n=1 Tax=Poseidonocella sp. HB161398 TaxID=2320855 RepID=UPI00110808DA|nr:bifunctional methylenetetrahydrofolate dehydrogenase/methenyltetrahydrofolate cyclohydrolase FolD [Poseidonocella sp. HB161398]
MTARLIDGRARAARLRSEIAQEVAALAAATGTVPGLAVILLGEDPASSVYVAAKIRATEAAGMHSVAHRLPAETSEAELLALIDRLNADPSVHGILVQLPLPPQISRSRVLEAVAPEKDVDGFHPVNAGRLASGGEGIVPCTPMGCLMLIEEELGDLRGKTALVIGCSPIVGRPMAQLLLRRDCTLLVAHRHTGDLPALLRQADIVIAAAGAPELVSGAWLKPGATVIDVGITRLPGPDGTTRLVGDVDFASAAEVAGAITPVPGGVGPMTIACLLANTLTACRRLEGLPAPAQRAA